MFVYLVWRNSTGSRKSNLDLFLLRHDEGKLKRLVYSYVQTDVIEIVIWNTRILKETFSFLFFLFVSNLSTVLLCQVVWFYIFFSSRLYLLEDRIARDKLWEVNMTYILDRVKKPLQLLVRIACSLSFCGQSDVGQLILSRRLKRFAGINAADLTTLLLQGWITNDNIMTGTTES